MAAYQLGAVDYIQKPVDREELVARIRVMLRLEDARSRLDRENVALRGQLMRAEQRLAEFAATFDGLQQLSQQRTSNRAPSVVTLSAELLVQSFDPDVCEFLGPLQVGMPLAGRGAAADRLLELLAAGATTVPFEVLDQAGKERSLLLAIRRLPSTDVLLMLQDVTGVLIDQTAGSMKVRMQALASGQDPYAVGGPKAASGIAIGLTAFMRAVKRVWGRFFLPYKPAPSR